MLYPRIKSINLISNTIVINVEECPNDTNVWLENQNKHYPDIFLLTHVGADELYFDVSCLTAENYHFDFCCILKVAMQHSFNKLAYQVELPLKISGSLDYPYKVAISVNDKGELVVKVECAQEEMPQTIAYHQALSQEDPITANADANSLHSTGLDSIDLKFRTRLYTACSAKSLESQDLSLESLIEQHDVSNLTQVIYKHEPIHTLVWGTCFSRSVFTSSPYFNPDYKRFFKVDFTAFHNSFISVMSPPVLDNTYTAYSDLMKDGIQDYVNLEFQKNIIDYIKRFNVKLLVIDNYIDATAPIVEIRPNQFFTYNKYFSESIYKKNFANCRIFYPGSATHLELYKDSLIKLHELLEQSGICLNIILIGARLSHHKIHIPTGKVSPWSDKTQWIEESNANWDLVDQALLQTLPEVGYIDMRNTQWCSDVDSPIIGGSSPSHYQSEYYKYLFHKLLCAVFNDGECLCKPTIKS